MLEMVHAFYHSSMTELRLPRVGRSCGWLMTGDSDRNEMVMSSARFLGVVPVKFPAIIFQQENLDDFNTFLIVYLLI